MEKKVRFEEIDMIKALAIICMVLGHTTFFGSKFVFLFHMAAFIMTSGYCFHTKYSDSVREGVAVLIWKRIKQLWFPYFLWQTVFICLNNFFLRINFFTAAPEQLAYLTETKMASEIAESHVMSLREILRAIIKSVYFKSSTQYSEQLWFLQSLFIVTIAYCVIDYLIKKAFGKQSLISQFAVSCVFLFLGYISKLRGIQLYGLARAASLYILFFLGYVFHCYSKSFRSKSWKYYLTAGSISLALLVSASFLYPGEISIDLHQNKYQNPIFYLVCSLAGWMLLYSLAYFIKQLPVKKYFTYIGTKTMSIMIFHYLFFKLVCCIVLSCYHLPITCLAAFPVLCGDRGIWWIAYGFAGVAGPAFLHSAYRHLIKRVRMTCPVPKR